jgi:hypothetical protein
VFKTKHFSRWSAQEALRDSDLCLAAREAFDGQVEADLGGYLFKKRIRRSGSGKSGGFRTILGFRKTDDTRIFFLFGFAKNERVNITAREQTALRANAEALVGLTDLQIVDLLRRAAIIELECET